MTDSDDEPSFEDEDFHHGFLSMLSMDVEEADDGRAVVRIPYREEIANPPTPDGTRSQHGGVVATAVDVAGILAVRSAYDGDVGLTTTDLNVSYLRPAAGDVVATGEVARAGGTLGVARVSVESDDGEGERVESATGRVSVRVWQ